MDGGLETKGRALRRWGGGACWCFSAVYLCRGRCLTDLIWFGSFVMIGDRMYRRYKSVNLARYRHPDGTKVTYVVAISLIHSFIHSFLLLEKRHGRRQKSNRTQGRELRVR